MLPNLRLSLRTLAHSPGFALVAILTLAVGIGSTTAIFSVLQALVISPYSYPKSEQLVQVWSGNGWPLSPADSVDLRKESTSYSAFGVYNPITVNVGQENAQSVMGVGATAGVLRAFGVQPMLGRSIEPADEVPGAAPVVVLSYPLWQQFFAGAPNALGRKMFINGLETEVVGVMPASFEFVCPWMRTADCMLWMPRTFDQEEIKHRDNHYLLGLARLKDGISPGMADAEVKTIGKRLTKLYPDSNTGKEFLVRTLHDEMTRDTAKQVWLLFGAVALVLLVACGNVASMLLARSAKRQGEFGVRVALGASRFDLLKMALAESVVLAIAGAILGAAFAWGGVELLRAIAPVTAARKAAIALNPGALGFGFLATALTALLAGLPPALAAMRTSLASVMRSDARGSVGSRSRHLMLRNLIIAQVAVAFILANGAVLFSQAYLKLIDENKGVAADNVIEAQINLHGPKYEKPEPQDRFWYALVDRVKALPGAMHVAITSKLPLEGGNNTNALVNDEKYDPTQRRLQVERSSVTGEYFATMGLRLLKGRNLQTEDRTGDIRGVVVNQRMVEKAWPNKDPIGEIMRGNNPGKPWYVARVVGVVENVKQWGAEAEVQPEMYTTPEGHWGDGLYLTIRTPVPLAQMVPLLKRELAAIDPELALRDVRTMHQVVDSATQGQRAVAGIVNFFMAVALGLVAVGLYGTLSYHVMQRTREIGVRVAIGALKGDIIRLVFAQGSTWVALGLALGLAGSIALSFALKSVVYHMDGLTAPPLILAGVAVGVAAIIACWLPARRAALLDPVEALRAD
jgi:predicted permease